MKQTAKQVNVSFSERDLPLWKEMRRVAKRERRSMASLLRCALAWYLARKDVEKDIEE